MLLQAEKDKFKIKQEIGEQGKKIQAAVSYFQGLQEMFVEQRDLFLKKVNADFEVLLKLLERKRSELTDKIHNAYDLHITKTHNFMEGLSALNETIEQIKLAEIKVDLD